MRSYTRNLKRRKSERSYISMNFTDAVKTNRPIRRKGWSDFLTLQECQCGVNGIKKHAIGGCHAPALMFPDYTDPKLTPEDFLADDWEDMQHRYRYFQFLHRENTWLLRDDGYRMWFRRLLKSEDDLQSHIDEAEWTLFVEYKHCDMPGVAMTLVNRFLSPACVTPIDLNKVPEAYLEE